MYVTRPLSLYRCFPNSRPVQPPGAPYSSGYLVVTDEEAEAQETCCWGACKNKGVTKLPFPQDKILQVVHSSEFEEASVDEVWFIPALDQPLSSNRYYVIQAHGKYKGLAYTCSRDDNAAGCCFRDVRRDPKPKPFDHRDIYQQVEVHRYFNVGFYAESVTGDGFPPKFLRRKGWKVQISTSLQVRETDDQGLNSTPLQMHLPNFNFPVDCQFSPPLVIASWYCPFVFVKEESQVADQIRISLLYEMTLEQQWEEICSCENERNESDVVVRVNASVEREEVLVYGMEGVKEDHRHGVGDDGFVWFRAKDQQQQWRRTRRRGAVGLSWAVVEKMRWVQERRGWGGDGGDGREGSVERVEEIISSSNGVGWRRFGCYVVAESFVLKRVDGLVLLSCKFRHTHRRQCKWE